MKNQCLLLLLAATFLLPFHLGAQLTKRPMLPATGIKSYGNLPVGELNRAHREQLAGQFEIALLTYNSALAWQPDWVPALAARSELLYRMGRPMEARKDRNQAERQNPNATAFYLAKGRNGLMPFLALYPKTWYQENYGIQQAEETPEESSFRQFFHEQYLAVTSAPDTALAVRVVRQKLDFDIRSAYQSLDELPRAYNEGVRQMLLGNLSMLNHNYREAVNLYTEAETKGNVDWPELRYNRGLGYILLHNYMGGCDDLFSASQEGFRPAAVMYDSLCNF